MSAFVLSAPFVVGSIVDLLTRSTVQLERLVASVIVDRLIAANKLTEALAAIAADPVIQARWNAATEIATDDPTARALCAAIGADPEVILAP